MIKPKEYKCLNVINYIVQKGLTDRKIIELVIYLTDRYHLQMVCNTMYKEKYRKASGTIVPNTAAEILDNLDSYNCVNEYKNNEIIKATDILVLDSNGTIRSKKDYDVGLFSNADYEALNNVISFVKRNNYENLIDRIQNDIVYKNTNENEMVDFMLLVRSVDNEYSNSKEESVENYINNVME
jgi:hypothetical protein